jgi:hypothetical protein
LRRGLLARLVHQMGRAPGRRGSPNLPEPRQWDPRLVVAAVCMVSPRLGPFLHAVSHGVGSGNEQLWWLNLTPNPPQRASEEIRTVVALALKHSRPLKSYCTKDSRSGTFSCLGLRRQDPRCRHLPVIRESEKPGERKTVRLVRETRGGKAGARREHVLDGADCSILDYLSLGVSSSHIIVSTEGPHRIIVYLGRREGEAASTTLLYCIASPP